MTDKLMSKSYLTPNQVAELMMVSPATVRQWAEKGELNALTTPGGHRRFLPSEVERFARKRGMTLPPENTGELRILIIDDDVQLSRYLQALFKGFAGQVVTKTVNDSFSAGFRAQEFKPHVVLLDLMMPGMDGFQVCRLLKSEPATKAVRVIAMTGFPSPENIKNIIEAGAETCLSKPLDEQLLLEHLGLNQPGNTHTTTA